MNKDTGERLKRQRQEVKDAGRNPKDYRYDMDTKNPYRIEHTKLGSYAYILVNDKDTGLGKEVKVDLSDFYTLRLYSYHWFRSSSDPKKDYPHTNTWDSNGNLINLLLHVLIMGTVDKKVIDHNDGDHYNASRSNLNHVTTAQNNQNRHPHLYPRKKPISAEYVSLYV